LYLAQTQVRRLHFVDCQRLLIRHIRNYPPYWGPFLHPQPEVEACHVDRDKLSRSVCNTYKIFKWHGLTLVGLEEAGIENDVTIVVNCYDVASHTHHYCKSDIIEC
jgi:hypothetical protein